MTQRCLIAGVSSPRDTHVGQQCGDAGTLNKCPSQSCHSVKMRAQEQRCAPISPRYSSMPEQCRELFCKATSHRPVHVLLPTCPPALPPAKSLPTPTAPQPRAWHVQCRNQKVEMRFWWNKQPQTQREDGGRRRRPAGLGRDGGSEHVSRPLGGRMSLVHTATPGWWGQLVRGCHTFAPHVPGHAEPS